MFTSQAPGMLNQLTRAGMPYEQAQALVGVIGQCMSSLKTNGMTEFNGPTRFAQTPQYSDGTGIIQLAQLQEDLTYGSGFAKAITQAWSPTGASSGGKQMQVYPGPFINSGETIAAGSLVGLVDFDGFKCPMGSNGCPS